MHESLPCQITVFKLCASEEAAEKENLAGTAASGAICCDEKGIYELLN